MEEARAVLAELAAMLSAGETELGTAISQLDQQLRETEKRTRAAIAEMEATCDRLESAIKACRPPSEGADRDRGLRRQGSGACREDLSLTATRGN